MSPATSRPSTRKHWLPGVWPGVCTRVIGIAPTRHHVATVVQDEIRLGCARDLLDAARFGPVDVDGRVDAIESEQRGDAFDLPPHEGAADVIRVVVGDERADDAQVVGTRDRHELAHAVRRVDDQRLARLAVADEVDEVHHLLRDLVVGREVTAGEELAEVEAVVGHGSVRSYPVSWARTAPLGNAVVCRFT